MLAAGRKGRRIARFINRLSPDAMTIMFKIIGASEELTSDQVEVAPAESYLIVQQCLKSDILTVKTELETVTIYSRMI